MKLNHILLCAAMAMPMTMAAQSINFEEQDYKQLGVWDTWEESPFRKGKLHGNYDVIDNHLTQVDEQLGIAINDSKKILAIQRSRYGSNTFGVRIDLNETFELTQETRYLHMLINRPYSGRVMVVGLGKRQDRAGQSPETEQFASISNLDVPGDRWAEVVLPIVGNGGIDIYSLVIVPDCESPHAYTKDEVCYIDKIEINNVSTPSIDLTDYPINFEDTEVITREDRFFSGVTVSGSVDGEQSLKVSSSKKLAYTFLENTSLTARPGETLNFDFKYTGSWMHTYVFFDQNSNGKFDVPIKEDGHPEAGTDAVAFSFFGPEGDFRNSDGQQVYADGSVVNPPSFTLPESVEPGFYRMRFKVDWNSLDAGGSTKAGNNMIANGGGIIDVNVNIHDEQCTISDFNRNGAVLSAKDGEKLDSYKAAFGEPFTIRMNPEKGFEYSGIIVRHGHKLNGESEVHGVAQWKEVRFERKEFNDKDEFTIPASCMDGEVRIEGLFIEDGTYVEPTVPTRYKTTTVTDEAFADTTAWYTLQMGQDGYVVSYNPAFSYFPMVDTFVDTDNDAQLWCFTGNEEEGYQLYNKVAGPTMILAATTDMGSDQGGSSYPYMYEKSSVPAGYASVWRFEDSDALGSTGVEYAYMYEDGYPSNKVNIRDGAWAFWSGGQDGGSTLRVCFAKQNLPTGIQGVEAAEGEKVYYDLSGRRVLKPAHGVYIANGHKVIVK